MSVRESCQDDETAYLQYWNEIGSFDVPEVLSESKMGDCKWSVKASRHGYFDSSRLTANVYSQVGNQDKLIDSALKSQQDDAATYTCYSDNIIIPPQLLH